ncbi:MAG TPA: lipopolysaccharide heptosyltransferase II [Geobacteraceae bacterium]|nr:lipopolysaccharide heptosyltransferase II [Geobacteraceae bacterium]
MQKGFNKISIRRILVRGTNWLGDAVMTTPALGRVRDYFPEARITLLANPLVAELFASHPWIDDVMIYDRKGRHAGLKGRLLMAGELKARSFDLAILLPNSLDSAFITWLARVPRRLGYATDGRGLLLTDKVPLSARMLTGHQTGYYLAMLEYFGVNGSPRSQLLTTTIAEDAGIRELLEAEGIHSDSIVIVVNPGAAYGSAKRWYPERFAVVADQLARQWNARVVITGGRDEMTIAEDICGMMISPCLNLAGKTGVREMMAIIKRCNFFITNDSGPMHIAAAFEVPLVAIFGSTDHMTTFPLARQTALVRKQVDCAPCMKRECPTDHRCMKEVTVEDVLAAAATLQPTGMVK